MNLPREREREREREKGQAGPVSLQPSARRAAHEPVSASAFVYSIAASTLKSIPVAKKWAIVCRSAPDTVST